MENKLHHIPEKRVPHENNEVFEILTSNIFRLSFLDDQLTKIQAEHKTYKSSTKNRNKIWDILFEKTSIVSEDTFSDIERLKADMSTFQLSINLIKSGIDTPLESLLELEEKYIGSYIPLASKVWEIAYSKKAPVGETLIRLFEEGGINGSFSEYIRGI